MGVYPAMLVPLVGGPTPLQFLILLTQKISRELLLGDHTTAILSPFPEDERRVLPVQALRFFFWGRFFRDQKRPIFPGF